MQRRQLGIKGNVRPGGAIVRVDKRHGCVSLNSKDECMIEAIGGIQGRKSMLKMDGHDLPLQNQPRTRTAFEFAS